GDDPVGSFFNRLIHHFFRHIQGQHHPFYFRLGIPHLQPNPVLVHREGSWGPLFHHLDQILSCDSHDCTSSHLLRSAASCCCLICASGVRAERKLSKARSNRSTSSATRSPSRG